MTQPPGLFNLHMLLSWCCGCQALARRRSLDCFARSPLSSDVTTWSWQICSGRRCQSWQRRSGFPFASRFEQDDADHCNAAGISAPF